MTIASAFFDASKLKNGNSFDIFKCSMTQVHFLEKLNLIVIDHLMFETVSFMWLKHSMQASSYDASLGLNRPSLTCIIECQLRRALAGCRS